MSKKINISDCSECYSEEVLIKYVNDELSPEETVAVENHILDCEICSDVIDGLLLLESTDSFLADKVVLNKEIDKLTNSVKADKASLFTYTRSIAAVAVLLFLSGGYFLINYLVKDKNISNVNKTISLSQDNNPSNTNQEDQIANLTEAQKIDTGAENEILEKERLRSKFETVTEEINIVNDSRNIGDLKGYAEQKSQLDESISHDESKNSKPLYGGEAKDLIAEIGTGNEQRSAGDRDANSQLTTINDQFAEVTSASSKGGASSREKADNRKEKKDLEKTEQNKPVSPSNASQNLGGQNLDGIVVVENAEPEVIAILDISGYDSAELEEEKIEPIAFATVEVKPQFPGGEAALMKFISENTVYPLISLQNAISGKVLLSFTINQNGDVTDVRVLKPVDPDLDLEAIRVVKSLPRWTPGRQRGKAVDVKYVIPITFRLF